MGGRLGAVLHTEMQRSTRLLQFDHEYIFIGLEMCTDVVHKKTKLTERHSLFHRKTGMNNKQKSVKSVQQYFNEIIQKSNFYTQLNSARCQLCSFDF